MSIDTTKNKAVEKFSLIGAVLNLIIGAAKIFIGFLSGSLAVIGDGIDSATDVITSLVGFFAAKIMSKPPDAGHPYGHHRAEAIATKLLSFVVFFAGTQLLIFGIQFLLSGEVRPVPEKIAIYVTLVSIVFKLFLAIMKFRVGKRVGSRLLIADAKNMRNDIILSFSIFVGLICSHIFNLSIIDPILAILVSLWILKVALEIFLESNTELMDGMEDTEKYKDVFSVIDSVPGASNPHRVRIRRLGSNFIVDLDIEVDGNLSVTEGHSIAQEVERRLREDIPGVYDTIVHIEPKGNLEKQERFGLSRDHLD